MIITKLTGGLGNQLFQYAMGRTLAIKNNTKLKFDISLFESYEWHTYSLAPFNIQEAFASTKECDDLRILKTGWINKLQRIFFKHNSFIKEESLRYNSAYAHIKAPAYIDGYWQCEKYFLEYEEILRKELLPKAPPSPANKAMLDSIQNSDAISLHIRRGNFVAVNKVNEVHGTCSMDYYQDAIKLVVTKCPKPCFFIFSDDILWAKNNLKITHDHVFVNINDDKTDFEDIRLMSNCKHHILANSTFSWWGAWLNPKNDKIVIAPKKWFNDPVLNEQSASIIPENWIRI